MDEELLTTSETSAMTKLAINTLANWRRDPAKRIVLPFYKIGRVVRYKKSEVLQFLQTLQVGGLK